MKVAVLVSCYNHEKFIGSCLESILNQTYKDFELFVWDNNSTDSSKTVINNYKDKYSFIFSDFSYVSNRVLPIGIARYLMAEHIINYYLKEEDGQSYYDAIAIIDGDDLWTPDKLEKQVNLMKKGYDLVFSDCYYLRYKEEVEQVENYPVFYTKIKDFCDNNTFFNNYPPLMSNVYFNLLTRYNFMPCPTLLFRTSLLKEVIGNPMHYTSAEDYDWILKMTLKGKASYVNSPLAYYRIHDNQITNRTPVRCTMEEIDVVKSNIKLKGGKYSMKDKVTIFRRLFILYLKLIYKEIIYN